MVSLPFFGLGILFPYGLAIGACVAVLNLNIISATIDKAAEKGKTRPVTLGFFVRILLYGGAFWLALRTSGVSALGAVIGMLLPRAAMLFEYAILPAIRRKLGKEPAPAYKADTRSRVFIKEPWLVRYSKGRAFVTHRHFKKVRVVLETGQRTEKKER